MAFARTPSKIDLPLALTLLCLLGAGCDDRGTSEGPEPEARATNKDAGARDAGSTSSGSVSRPTDMRAAVDAAKPRPSLDASAPSAPSARDGATAAPVARDGAPSTVVVSDAGGSSSGTSFPDTGDLAKDGPYGSTTMMNSGPGGSYTVYRPAMLAPQGAKHPIVGWMSGGGTTHTLYPLLPRLATHGFVVVAANVMPGIGQEVELGKQLIAGIEWAIAESQSEASALFDKLDTSKIAAMGYSMGSLATFTIASDPRLTTTVHISGGNMAPERIANLRQPAAFLCGTPGTASCNILSTDCDIAAANCDMDFKGATTPVFYANYKGGHLGILTPPLDNQIGLVAAQWLRWKLMSDSSLDPVFEGDQCTVCKDPNWKVQQK